MHQNLTFKIESLKNGTSQAAVTIDHGYSTLLFFMTDMTISDVFITCTKIQSLVCLFIRDWQCFEGPAIATHLF